MIEKQGLIRSYLMTWSLSLIKRGYDREAGAHKVLSDDMESEFAKHIKNLAEAFAASNTENLHPNWQIETTSLS